MGRAGAGWGIDTGGGGRWMKGARQQRGACGRGGAWKRQGEVVSI